MLNQPIQRCQELSSLFPGENGNPLLVACDSIGIHSPVQFPAGCGKTEVKRTLIGWSFVFSQESLIEKLSDNAADLALFEISLDAGHFEAHWARRPDNRHNSDLRCTQPELSAVAQINEPIRQTSEFVKTVGRKPLKAFLKRRNRSFPPKRILLVHEDRQRFCYRSTFNSRIESQISANFVAFATNIVAMNNELVLDWCGSAAVLRQAQRCRRAVGSQNR